MSLSSPLSAAEIPWIVSANDALKMRDSIDIWETRSGARYTLGHVEGSHRVSWKDFSQTKKPNKGKLLDHGALQTQLRKHGVRTGRPIFVLGDPIRGWGEEGRIVWMLRAVGHPAAMIDGGFDAMKRAGAETASGWGTEIAPGDVTITKTIGWSADASDVQDALKSKVAIVDVREPREYAGKTPYGESRGGHVPGAVSLHYKELLAEDGTLLPRSQLLKKLNDAGIAPTREVIAYCTGGVRSGWMVVVLSHLGFGAKNYAGSMWEWTAGSVDDFPVE